MQKSGNTHHYVRTQILVEGALEYGQCSRPFIDPTTHCPAKYRRHIVCSLLLTLFPCTHICRSDWSKITLQSADDYAAQLGRHLKYLLTGLHLNISRTEMLELLFRQSVLLVCHLCLRIFLFALDEYRVAMLVL